MFLAAQMATQAVTDSKAAQVRQARRKLQSRIRNDWAYSYDASCPNVSTSAVSTSGNDQTIHSPNLSHDDSHEASSSSADDESGGHPLELDHDDEPIHNRALGWVERTYASSDPSSEEDTSTPMSPTSNRSPLKPELQIRRKRDLFSLTGHRREHSGGSNHARSSSDPCTLSELPSTSQDSGERRKDARKQRRKARLAEEMSWNEGLRFWQARRDAWCCAKKVSVDELENHLRPDASDGHDSGHASNESPERPSSDDAKKTLRRPSSQVTLVPIPPPLIAETEPIHIKINPSLYPSIYSKVVLQSLTPSVPIKLSHMIPALVDGWKRDGEWPPKSADVAAPAPVVSRERALQEPHEAGRLGMSHVRRGMARVKRGLRLSLSNGSASGTGTAEV